MLYAEYVQHVCIKNDQPGSHDFRQFLRQFWTDFPEILLGPFSMLTGVKNAQKLDYLSCNKIQELV